MCWPGLERDVQNAVKAFNRGNRGDVAGIIEPAVEKSKQSALLLAQVLSATKRPEGVINEDAARALVMQGRSNWGKG